MMAWRELFVSFRIRLQPVKQNKSRIDRNEVTIMSLQNLLKLIILSAFVVFVCTTVFAQRPPGGRPPQGPPQEGRPPFDRVPGERGQPPQQGFPQGPPPNTFLSADARFDNKVVKGAPYSAQATAEFVQTLANGVRISRKNTATFYRDSEGRTRRDVKLSGIGPFPLAGNEVNIIFINDPVTGESYSLDTQERIARRMKMPPRPNPPQQEGIKGPPEADAGKTESLGKKTIEGIEVEGTRTTWTIPVGQIGNDQPIDVIAETWFSKELQIVVMSKHSDPRFGENIYRLTNINRTEPQRSLFTVPNDYRIADAPPPMRDRNKGRSMD
jgi:hypothetical protein